MAEASKYTKSGELSKIGEFAILADPDSDSSEFTFMAIPFALWYSVVSVFDSKISGTAIKFSDVRQAFMTLISSLKSIKQSQKPLMTAVALFEQQLTPKEVTYDAFELVKQSFKLLPAQRVNKHRDVMRACVTNALKKAESDFELIKALQIDDDLKLIVTNRKAESTFATMKNLGKCVILERRI
jgi:hypothetical protein